MKKIPVWIKLQGVPLELFSPEGIACIASAVRNFLYLDKATEERRRVSFARVYIDVNSQGNLPKNIEVDIEGRGLISVSVEYPWGAKFSSICRAHNHVAAQCKWGTKVWIIREVVPSDFVPTQPYVDKPSSGKENNQAKSTDPAVDPQNSKSSFVEGVELPSEGSAQQFAGDPSEGAPSVSL